MNRSSLDDVLVEHIFGSRRAERPPGQIKQVD